jgi:glycerol kinase
MQKPRIVALDIGTTNSKAAVINLEGHRLMEVHTEGGATSLPTAITFSDMPPERGCDGGAVSFIKRQGFADALTLEGMLVCWVSVAISTASVEQVHSLSNRARPTQPILTTPP